MTTTAKQLRAERFAEIGAIIRRDAAAVVGRWAARAAEEQPAAPRVHHEELLDHLPEFLQGLGAALAEAGGPDGGPHRPPAALHGEQRWRAGWSPAEVVRDYRVLRMVLLEYLDEALARPLRLREAQAVGLAIDEAAEASVASYALERDEAARRQEEALRERAEALKQADRRKDDFLAALGHELRNPLAPVLNGVQLLRMRPNDPAVAAQARDVIGRQAAIMAGLVDDLLDVSRIAQGKLLLEATRCDLAALAVQAAEDHRSILEGAGLSLSASAAGGPLWVKGDRRRLAQAVGNLLHNAGKFTDRGGAVRVAASREGDWAEVRVEDTGVGMTAEMAARAFGLHAQDEVLREERNRGGLGLGLALVKGLIEMQGGQVRAHSDGPGRGSAFTIRLPLAEDQ